MSHQVADAEPPDASRSLPAAERKVAHCQRHRSRRDTPRAARRADLDRSAHGVAGGDCHCGLAATMSADDAPMFAGVGNSGGTIRQRDTTGASLIGSQVDPTCQPYLSVSRRISYSLTGRSFGNGKQPC